MVHAMASNKTSQRVRFSSFSLTVSRRHKTVKYGGAHGQLNYSPSTEINLQQKSPSFPFANGSRFQKLKTIRA